MFLTFRSNFGLKPTNRCPKISVRLTFILLRILTFIACVVVLGYFQVQVLILVFENFKEFIFATGQSCSFIITIVSYFFWALNVFVSAFIAFTILKYIFIKMPELIFHKGIRTGTS